MRPAPTEARANQTPQLLDKAVKLNARLKKLSPDDLVDLMKISEKLATKTHELIQNWTPNANKQRTAIDSFLGDIYSGLRVSEWSQHDRDYANQTLRILSGLYGVLRPLDGIHPYRLEMGYRLKPNLYKFWQDTIAKTIPKNEIIINLAAVEYTKSVLPYMDNHVITPSFLTISPKTGEPTFVVVHAKIARGSFARWIIKNRVEDVSKLPKFDDLNYVYNAKLSTETEPVFICKTFGGIGLSMRLTEDSATIS